MLASFSLLVAEDVDLDAPDLDLDGAEEWAADTCARLPGGSVPATEWMAVTSRAAAASSRGRTVGSRSASMVLPTPGGPSSRR